MKNDFGKLEEGTEVNPHLDLQRATEKKYQIRKRSSMVAYKDSGFLKIHVHSWQIVPATE